MTAKLFQIIQEGKDFRIAEWEALSREDLKFILGADRSPPRIRIHDPSIASITKPISCAPGPNSNPSPSMPNENHH